MVIQWKVIVLFLTTSYHQKINVKRHVLGVYVRFSQMTQNQQIIEHFVDIEKINEEWIMR